MASLRQRPPERNDQLPNVVECRVVRPPANTADAVGVVVPAFDVERLFEVRYWQSRGGTLPVEGDVGLLAKTEDDEPWLVSWWPADGDDPVVSDPDIAAALAAKQDAATAATDSELAVAVATINAALAGKQDASTAATDSELSAAVATLNAAIALKQDASTAATDSELSTGLAAKQDTSEKAQANGYASLDSGGKVPSGQLPAIAITSISVVASQVAQLALTAQEGDVAVRSDQKKTYIHNGGTAGSMADWTELQTPTDLVLSVNGQTGAVTLTKSDVGLGNVTDDAQIPKSLADAADDLLVASGADVWARKAKGSPGQVLGVDPAGAVNWVNPTAAAFLLIPRMLALGPSMLWGLDGVNLGVDLSNNGRTGTVGGTITLGTAPGLYGVNGATDFPGASGRISSAYNPFTAGSTRTFTGWAFRDGSGAIHTIFGGDAAGGEPWLRLNTGSQTVEFYPNSGLGHLATWTNAWPGNGRWVHWALIYNDTTRSASLYINGALVSTQTVTGTGVYDAPGNFKLGAVLTATNPFDGKMTVTGIYERALTAVEIRSIYKVGTGNHPGHETWEDVLA